jgi:hypothetical protein
MSIHDAVLFIYNYSTEKVNIKIKIVERGNNDSTSTQIHDRSQATTIQQSHKYMTNHRPQRFQYHTNTCPLTLFLL